MKELSTLDGNSAKKTARKTSSGSDIKTGSKSDLRPFFAFFASLALYAFVMILFKKYPLGDDAFLISDLKAQYAPFLALMRSKIVELGSVPQDQLISYLTYSFQLGMGKNFIGTVGYYLASPFNLIYLLVDETQVNLAVILIVVLKLSLSSSFMCLFLGKRIDDKKSLWPVLFGILYAFSLYAQAFMFNIMWLDGYMLLPLILFFTEKFIKKQQYAGLIISLLVLFVSNYYIAYMAGIACFIYLCIRMLEESVPLKTALGTGLRYVLTAGFTGLITAVLLLPVGLDTITNSDQTVLDRSKILLSYTPVTLIHMFIMGESDEFGDVMPGNYPFLFISILVILLTLIYFLSPVFKSRERKIHAFCILGVLLSTAFAPLDRAWQVFDDPNWFWHRHAFVFLPLFLVISIKTISRMKEVVRKDIVKAMLIMFLLIILDMSVVREKGASSYAVLMNMCITLVYSGFFAGYGIEKWPDQIRDMPRMLSPILSGIICFEVAFASPVLYSSIATMTLKGGNAYEYINSIQAEKEFGAYVDKSNDVSGAFRAETEKPADYAVQNCVKEGGAFYGNYNGVAFFNSNSNKSMHRFAKQLGLATNYNYFSVSHFAACPSVDSFYSVGSVAARRDLSFYRLNGGDTYGDGLKFYENDNVLPLAFAIDEKGMDFDFYRLEKDAGEKDYFALQNDWYRSMFPEAFTEDFFIGMDESVTGQANIKNGVFYDANEYRSYQDILISEENAGNEDKAGPSAEDPLGLENSVYGDLKSNLTTIYRMNSKIPIVIEYEFKAPSENEMFCTIVTDRIIDGTDVYVNGIKINKLEANTYYSSMVRIGSFKTGEDVKVTFMADSDSWTYLNIRFASFDNDVFTSQMEKVDKSKVSVNTLYDGYAKFDVKNVDSDETVITTIPAEDGWTLYIDGAPAEYKVYQNAFISFDVSEGNHTAELVFTAPGLKTGAMVSCAGIVLLAAFVLIDKCIIKKKKS